MGATLVAELRRRTRNNALLVAAEPGSAFGAEPVGDLRASDPECREWQVVF
jgi:hypothetical protein